MGARAALIVVTATVAAGCGGGESFGPPPGQWDMGLPATDLGTGGCNASTVVVTQSSPTVPATLTARAQAFGTRPVWTLFRAGDANRYEPTISDDGFRAGYDAKLPGTWTFHAQFPNSTLCTGNWSQTLDNPAGKRRPLRLRALPPQGSYMVTDLDDTLVGGTPRSDLDITLGRGTPVAGHVVAAGDRAPVAGELRFLAQIGADAVTHVDGSGAFVVALQQSMFYRTLFIPDAPTLAPTLEERQQSPSSINNVTFAVAAGEPVAGVVRAGGVAVGGARVVLRHDDLPSGLGVSAEQGGAFSLRARAGDDYTITVGGDALPEAVVDHVAVPAGGLALDVAYTVPFGEVTGVVTSSAGVVLSGARVTIRSRRGGLGTVAVFGVGAEMRSAAGRVNRVVTTTSVLPPLSLPVGTYDVIVEPPSGSSDGLTTFTLTAPGDWKMQLQPPVELAGVITSASDGKGAAGVRVTARAQLGLGAAPTVVTDERGRYRFSGANGLGAGTPSTLLVAPPAASHLAGTSIDVDAGTGSIDVALAPGMVVSGVVRGDGNLQRGVRVESLCIECTSPTPEASALTDADGRYVLYLTDPGETAVADGGAGD